MKKWFLHLLEEEAGQQKIRQAMQGDNYLIVSPKDRPAAKYRQTLTGLRVQGVNADQVFFNRQTGRPELVVGRVGKGRKLMVYRVGWSQEAGSNGQPSFQKPTPPQKPQRPQKPKRWRW